MAGAGLSRKAVFIHDRLQVLDRLTSESVQLLDVLGNTLYDLTNLTAPIHSRATALTGAQRNIADAKAALDALLEHLDTSKRVEGALAAGPARDLDGFLDALQQLEASNDYLHNHARLAAVRTALQQSQLVFNAALETCGADFRASLDAAGRSAAPTAAWIRAKLDVAITEETLPDLLVEVVPPSLLPKLRRMVDLMLEARYAPAQAGFNELRSAAVVVALQELGLELQPAATLGAMTVEQLEPCIVTWNTQLRAVTLLMLSEQRLADSIWPRPVGQELFAALLQPHLQALLESGHDLVDAKKWPDKVFLLLDMHRHLTASAPVLRRSLLSDEGLGDGAAARRSDGGGGGGGLGSRTRAALALVAELQGLAKLAAAAAAVLFSEYEEGVARDATKVLPMDGTIHPLTAQVLAYIKRMLSYENAAEVMYGDPAQHRHAADPDAGPDSAGAGAGDGPGDSPAVRCLSAGVARLLMQLMDNLESKGRAYRNEALAALFMMNNVHYVTWSVEASTALGLLGRDWLERHKDVVEDWGARYNDLTWMPLVAMLKAEAPPDAARLKLSLKETFSAFNAAIDRIYSHQSGWTIPDHSLRTAVKRVIKDDLLGTYQDFMRRYAEVPFTSNPAKYIRYAVSDVAAIIDDDLFETKAVSMNKLSLTREKLGAIV